jgi:hypothetical protein
LDVMLDGLKPGVCGTLKCTAEQVAEKDVYGKKRCPRRLKPNSKQHDYRSAEALRHPKSEFFRSL